MLKSLVLFALMLTIIVFIHEFGHFIMAKLFKVYVYEFSIGMGPKLLQFKGKETTYSLRLLPLGGYCAMAGESDNANIQEIEQQNQVIVPKERNLNNINRFKQILIMVAGPVMNFILAWVILLSINATLGYKIVYPIAKVEAVSANSAAEKAGIQVGDIISEVKYNDGTTTTIENFYDFIETISLHGESEPLTCVIDRNGKMISIDVTPTFNEQENRYMIGISAPEAKAEDIKGMEVIEETNREFSDNALMIFKVLKRLIKGKGLENLSGPVGIYNVTSEVASYGLVSFISLIAVLSLNLGVMNLLPIPLFDGGRIVIAIIESIIRRPLSEKLKAVLMTISLVIVLLLFVFLTYNDISKLFN